MLFLKYGEKNLSKKPFKGKEKAPRNKSISKKKDTKKSSPRRKNFFLTSYNIGKSWFHHEEELWDLELCCENANGRKTVPVGNINWNDHESYSDYDEYANDAANQIGTL